jgi:hypothetical protein
LGEAIPIKLGSSAGFIREVQKLEVETFMSRLIGDVDVFFFIELFQ